MSRWIKLHNGNAMVFVKVESIIHVEEAYVSQISEMDDGIRSIIGLANGEVFVNETIADVMRKISEVENDVY